jgi:hypothetical protein
MPLFLVADPAESTGLISIAMACLVLDEGNLNRNTPGILVAPLSQSPTSLRKIIVVWILPFIGRFVVAI